MEAVVNALLSMLVAFLILWAGLYLLARLNILKVNPKELGVSGLLGRHLSTRFSKFIARVGRRAGKARHRNGD